MEMVQLMDIFKTGVIGKPGKVSRRSLPGLLDLSDGNVLLNNQVPGTKF
jgi:hypothetical protein